MNHQTDMQVADTRLTLLAGRAVFWPHQQTLMVADPHLGKEATFRRHAIPVPRGSSAGTLRKISDLITRTRANHLVVLGDLFHARSSLSADVRQAIERFFASHPHLRFTLVMGNHDQHVGALPPQWPIEVVPEGTKLGVMTLGHHPIEVPDEMELWVCGHLHPAISVGSGADGSRLPCFWLSRRCLVLPAIGEFTGTHRIRPANSDQVWVIADDSILPLHGGTSSG